MHGEVREADFVLAIASAAYCRRAEGLAEPDEGRGVQFEAALIREEMYRDRQAGIEKFLPVLLPGASREDIPAFLGPTTATSYRVTEMTPQGVEQLLRVLTRLVGTMGTTSPRNVATDDSPSWVSIAVMAASAKPTNSSI